MYIKPVIKHKIDSFYFALQKSLKKNDDDDCSGKGLRIWLENLRILNFATHILWFSICIFLFFRLKKKANAEL
jgi:hypothetical protein